MNVYLNGCKRDFEEYKVLVDKYKIHRQDARGKLPLHAFLKHNKRCGSTGCTGKAGQQQTCFHLGRIFHGIHSLLNDAELLS